MAVQTLENNSGTVGASVPSGRATDTLHINVDAEVETQKISLDRMLSSYHSIVRIPIEQFQLRFVALAIRQFQRHVSDIQR